QIELPESEEQMAALEELFRLRSRGVAVVLFEMPVHLTPTEWPPAQALVYARAMDRVRLRAQREGVPFWTARPELIPPDGWVDLWHLNARGAETFSRWLGERAAAAVHSGELPALGGAASSLP